MAKKKNELQRLAMRQTGLGITTMAGMGAVGAMASMPGVPAGAAAIPVAGLNLVNVGGLAQIGMGLARMTGSLAQSNKKRRRK